jgi:succinate dehydrogenase hydrophobic anchor subunit
MAQKILNEYSKGNTVAFWVTILIGLALLGCMVWLFIDYTAITF